MRITVALICFVLLLNKRHQVKSSNCDFPRVQTKCQDDYDALREATDERDTLDTCINVFKILQCAAKNAPDCLDRTIESMSVYQGTPYECTMSDENVLLLESTKEAAYKLLKKKKLLNYGKRQCDYWDPPWDLYHDPYQGQDYCYRSDPWARTFSDAREECLKLGAKIVTPRGDEMHSSAHFSQADGILRWIDVTYDYILDMYVQNGGVPLDTNWLTWTPWDTEGGHPSYGQRGRNCTVTNNLKWKSVPCTHTQHYICEFKICPDGWVYNPYVDRCNKFFDNLDHFELATQRCSESEAIIETPRSREAEQFLKKLTAQPSSTILWIGMMNLEETTWFDNTTWRWNDGVKVTWTAWDGHTTLHVSNRRFKDSKHAEYKCMSTNVAGGIIDKQHVWSRSGCKTVRVQAKYVCGKISCRYPYTTLLNPETNKTYPTCYRAINTPVNARQAGQFCAEDGSQSNPSRLASPDNSLEFIMLNRLAPYHIWTGYAWNRAHLKWQKNDNTFVVDPFEIFRIFNFNLNPTKVSERWWSNHGDPVLRWGRIGQYAKGYDRYSRHSKGYDRYARFTKGYDQYGRPDDYSRYHDGFNRKNGRWTVGYGPYGPTVLTSPIVWASRGRVCAVRRRHNMFVTPYACYWKFGLACERQQPYVLTTCPMRIQNAARVQYVPDNSPYYPSVPQTQKMTCYYYNTEVATMNYAEANRYCAGLGGYIIMPKSKRQLVQAVSHLSRSRPPRVWIGADQIGHCFNQNSRCTPNSTNFKYLDGSDIFGSDLGLPRWQPGAPDNYNDQEDCVYIRLGSLLLNDDQCTEKKKLVCQVAHNNLKTRSNWDFLIACTADYEDGVANWYAAGDKCLHTIMTKQRQHFHNDFRDKCKALSRYYPVTPSHPVGRDQTRSLLLSRSMNINSLSTINLKVAKSYIGVMTLNQARGRINHQEGGYSSGHGDDGPSIGFRPIGGTKWVWKPYNGSCIPIQLLNFIGTDHESASNTGNCIQMKANGRWQKIPCSYERYFSCEKPSIASLATWRAAYAAGSDEASGADAPRFESRWACLVITSSFLFWV